MEVLAMLTGHANPGSSGALSSLDLSGQPLVHNESSRQSVKLLGFYAGSERMNPVPLMVLGEMHRGLLGGFISGLIHT